MPGGEDVGDGVGDGVGEGDGVGVVVVELYRFRLLYLYGVALCVVVPSPNWPYSLDPHAQTVPSDFQGYRVIFSQQ